MLALWRRNLTFWVVNAVGMLGAYAATNYRYVSYVLIPIFLIVMIVFLYSALKFFGNATGIDDKLAIAGKCSTFTLWIGVLAIIGFPSLQSSSYQYAALGLIGISAITFLVFGPGIGIARQGLR